MPIRFLFFSLLILTRLSSIAQRDTIDVNSNWQFREDKNAIDVSDKADNYGSAKMYNLPDIKPGEQIDFEVDEINNGNVFVTIVRPTGNVVSQKSF